MRYTITGENLQLVNIEFSEDESIYSHGGAMAYMTGNVSMDAKMRGGLGGGLKRAMTGKSFFIVNYRASGGNGIAGFGGNIPGKIYPLEIGEDEWLCQRESFLVAEDGVDMDLAFQKRLRSAFFGGEGFILQRLHGKGTAFIHAAGDFTVVDLKEGQQYKVSTSHAVAWEKTVDYSISTTGSLKTALFAGEGLFVTTLTGPGKIIIQSLSLQDLAYALHPHMPKPRRSGSSISLGSSK